MPAAPQRGNASTLQRLNVTITNRQKTRAVDLRFLRRIVKTLLAELQLSHADLVVHLVGAPEITRLNEAFLHHAGTTDVITFDYAEDAGLKASDSRLEAHGEIFICMNEAVVQAGRFRTTWESEVLRYAVHGILHLLGHDDLNSGTRKKMKREENRLLRDLSRRFRLKGLAKTPSARVSRKP